MFVCVHSWVWCSTFNLLDYIIFPFLFDDWRTGVFCTTYWFCKKSEIISACICLFTNLYFLSLWLLTLRPQYFIVMILCSCYYFCQIQCGGCYPLQFQNWAFYYFILRFHLIFYWELLVTTSWLFWQETCTNFFLKFW